MRNILLGLMICGSLFLVGCNASKVAVINSAKIYQDSAAGKAGLAYLESVEQEVRAKAEAAQKVAETMPTNPELPLALQQFFASCQSAMNDAQQDAVKTVQELIKKTIDDYRAKENIAIIMQNEAAVSFDATADITDKIIAQMNAAQVKFAPVKVADFVAPSAPAPKAPTAPAKKSVKK